MFHRANWTDFSFTFFCCSASDRDDKEDWQQEEKQDKEFGLSAPGFTQYLSPDRRLAPRTFYFLCFLIGVGGGD